MNALIKIAITGGSGFIGTAAVDYAIAQGFEVMNLDIKVPNKTEHTAYWRKTDLRDRIALERALKQFQPSHILHLAAKTGMDIKHLDELSANTQGVADLITICRELPDLQRVLFTSSLLVCENGYLPQHDTDYCPPNLYGESKMIGEQLVRDAKELPFGWLIVRPTSVWGSWFEHSYKTFFQTIARNHYFHVGSAQLVKPICYVGNAVHMMFSLLFAPRERTQGETFYLADYPCYTVKEWATCVQETLGSRPIRALPLPILRAFAKLGDCCKTLGWKNPPLTSFRLNNMLTGGQYPSDKTQAVVGELPYSLTDGVHTTIDWMKKTQLL